MTRKHVLVGCLMMCCCLLTPALTLGQEKIQIGTAPQGGTYYALGAGIAQILNKWGGLNATAQSTGGGVQNCRLIDAGEIVMATLAGQQIVDAYKGEKPFTKKIDLRVGFFMDESPFAVVVLDNSPIKSFYDMKGKKVAVGAMGSGVEGKIRLIFGPHGLNYENFTPTFIGMAQATDALKDGMVDAAVIMGPLPVAAITEISVMKKVRILPLADEMIGKISNTYPYLLPFVIPPNTYKNQPNEVKTLAEASFIVFSHKMTDDVAYRITKTTFEHLDHLATIHKAAEKFSIKKAGEFEIGVPYHAGAIKYYREAGVWKK